MWRHTFKGRAFTLVELLMVIAIMAVVTAITIPSFVTSMRGSRLRTSVRTVVKIGRYSRSLAVLKQIPMTVSFDLDSGMVSSEGGDGKDNISRSLDRVKLVSLETIGEDKCTEGIYKVVYQTNGRCKPYTIVIADQDGTSAKIHVDALASASTEAGDEWK